MYTYVVLFLFVVLFGHGCGIFQVFTGSYEQYFLCFPFLCFVLDLLNVLVCHVASVVPHNCIHTICIDMFPPAWSSVTAVYCK